MLELKLSYNAKVVAIYPYRTARVRDILFTVEGGNDVHWMQEQIIKKSDLKKDPDNHTCYAVDFNGEILYYMFTDNKMHVGKRLEEGCW